MSKLHLTPSDFSYSISILKSFTNRVRLMEQGVI